MRIILFISICISIFGIGCAGSYNEDFKKDQSALVYLGHPEGNRILYLNSDKFPKLEIRRKRENDSVYQYVETLKKTFLALQWRVGYNGPGYGFDWYDKDDASNTTRYIMYALDDSSKILTEVKGIFSIWQGKDKGFKYIEK